MRMPEQIFDEEALTKYWLDNKTRFGSVFPLNEFLTWCWEWVDTCNKIRKMVKIKEEVVKYDEQ